MTKTNPSRREFLRNTALGAAGLSLAGPTFAGGPQAKAVPAGNVARAFKLKYGPPIGMFELSAGKNPIDQIKFMADQGFRAWFDNGLMNRPVGEQEALAKQSSRLGMAIGPFVAYGDFTARLFVTGDKSLRDVVGRSLSRPSRRPSGPGLNGRWWCPGTMTRASIGATKRRTRSRP